MPSRIRQGDMVAVVSGNDRGKRGRVLRVIPEKSRVVVEGVNYIHKHIRKSQKYPQGGRIRREAPIHISNVMMIDPSDNKPARVGIQLGSEGARTRVSRRTGSVLGVDAEKPSKGKGEE